MNRTLLTLGALLFWGTALQAQIVSFPTFAPAVTTGAVGLAASQTAQLNVVNLNTASSNTTTTATLPCQIQLEFWDSTGKMVKSSGSITVAPGATGSLQLKLSEVTTNTSPLRTDIRGVVRRTATPPPTAGTGTTPAPTPTIPTFIGLACSVATTLEIFDNTTGATQSLTSDLHTLEDSNPWIALPTFAR